jgi:hypothetical protein
MRTRIPLLLLALLASSSQSATLFGAYDCSQWFSLTQDPLPKTWLLGYLSGMDYATPTHSALDRLKSAEQAYLWIDNYCKANPSKKISDGAKQLYNELEKNAAKR